LPPARGEYHSVKYRLFGIAMPCGLIHDAISFGSETYLPVWPYTSRLDMGYNAVT